MSDRPTAASDEGGGELFYLPIAAAAERIRAGQLSPVELLAAVFARIDTTDAQLNAYVRLMRESAFEEAHAAEDRMRRGQGRGPLDGIPIGVKDLFDTAGVVTAGGARLFRDRVPETDATVVERLRAVGAVISGKTNTHELALGGTTNNVYYGATHNPWKLDRVPGGSSGGSAAAVAAGQCLAALGTDTAGSIRIPAAFCGVTGHKPTYGLVGRGGVIPLALTLDHAGPLARSALDCALLLNVLAGQDPRDHDAVQRPGEDFTAGIDAGIGGLRLVVIPSFVDRCTEPVRRNFVRSVDVLRDLGAEIVGGEPMGDVDDWRGPLYPIMVTEGASHVEHILRSQPELIDEPTRTRLLAGLETRATWHARALECRKEVQAEFERVLVTREAAAYIVPTSPRTAEPIAAEPHADVAPPEKSQNTCVFNYTRQPSLTVPNGFDDDGLPTGLMISGRLWHDATVLRIGHAFQQATDFHRKRPSL